MLSVHTEWDPLKVCVVGKNYPPEFYTFIKNSKLRNLLEKIAEETEEDYQKVVDILQSFGVTVLRPTPPKFSPEYYIESNLPIPGPISAIPRDQMNMLGDKFFLFPQSHAIHKTNRNHTVKSSLVVNYDDIWSDVRSYVESHGNEVIDVSEWTELQPLKVNGLFRIGRDVFFGTKHRETDKKVIDSIEVMKTKWLKDYKTHTVTTGGHIDGVFNPLKPGLIFSAWDADAYNETFPDWEVVYFEANRMNSILHWMKLRQKNHGKWWLPGIYDDDDIIDYVETWLKDWVGYIEETVFDVNLLMIDEKNAIVPTMSDKANDAFKRHGITPHHAPIRHRFFWDGAIHCLTAELHREGVLRDVL